jgi:hypothetical protein
MKADHSPPPSGKVKNEWLYTSIPPLCLHGMVLSEKKSAGTILSLQCKLQQGLLWRYFYFLVISHFPQAVYHQEHIFSTSFLFLSVHISEAVFLHYVWRISIRHSKIYSDIKSFNSLLFPSSHKLYVHEGPSGIHTFSFLYMYQFSSHCVQTGSEAHPASYAMGNGALSLQGKAARVWSYTATPLIHLHGVVLG